MTLSNWGLLLLTAAAFAISLPLNRVLVVDLSPLLLALLRTAVAFPAVWLISLWWGGLPAKPGEWITSALGGVLVVAVPFSAIAWGQQYITSSLGGILYATMPLMTAAFAHFVIAHERLTARKIAGLVNGLFGIVFVVGPLALVGLGAAPLGEAITLLAPLSYALGTVLLRRRPPMNPVRLLAGMFLVGQLIMLPIVIIKVTADQGLGHSFTVETAALLAALALAGTALPAYLNYLLILRSGATHASLVMLFVPVFAVVLGAVVLAEPIHFSAVLGLACILLGSLAVTYQSDPRTSS